MELILFSLLLLLVFVVEFVVLLSIERKIRAIPKNKVHFYVARDQNESLWLYIGKPRLGSITYRPTYTSEIIGGIFVFPVFGLDENDYANLKFGDEPVEVFINMED